MTDPLDALAAPIVPVAPDPVFAARLRSRVERELALSGEEAGRAERDRTEHDRAGRRPAGREEEESMTDARVADQVSRNGTRHGDVSYVTFAVPDAEAARRFYGRVLGWRFGTDAEGTHGDQVEEVVPQIGFWPGPAWREEIRSGAMLGWRVDDLAVAVEEVRASGGSATDPLARPYGLESECTDGNGLRFWLHELPPAGSAAGSSGEREGDVSYVVLRVAELESARRLFGEVLGWSYSPGASGVHVEGPAPMTGMSEGPPGATLCYRVDDIATAVERVRSAGGMAAEVTPRPYGLESLCTDDQEIEFYLHQF